jgi:hypothetical protein
MWFSEDTRQELIQTIRDLFAYDRQIKDILDKISRTRTREDSEKIRFYLAQNKKTIDTYFNNFISEDLQLLHLLIELRRNKRLNTDVDEASIEKIYSLVKKLQGEANGCKDLLQNTINHERDYVDLFDRLDIFLLSMNQEIEDISGIFGRGIVKVGKKVFELTSDHLTIALYRDIKNYKNIYNDSTHNSPFGLFVFDNQILVAEVFIIDYGMKFTKSDFFKRVMTCSYSKSLIHGFGYVQRTIESLLFTRRIDVWQSDNQPLSSSAIAMYDRLGNSGKFIVEDHDHRKRVILKKI